MHSLDLLMIILMTVLDLLLVLLMDHLLLILGMLVVLFLGGRRIGLVFVVCRVMDGAVLFVVVVGVVFVGRMLLGLGFCCIPWQLMMVYYYY